MPIRPLSRLGRAGVFAAVCVALGATGHAVVSGAPVAPWAVAFGFAGIALLALALAGHERSLATILGGLLGGQFALHVLFSAVRPAAAVHAVAHGGHGASGHGYPAGGSPAYAVQHLGASADAHRDLRMALAHYAAALLAAWWLRRGERAVWTLTREVAALAARPARALLAAANPAAVIGPVRVPVPVLVTIRPARRTLRHAVLRRGPPFRSRALSLG